jgi:DNA-binding transcriptional regulator/RsmH inhibitor MraZ
MALGIKYAKIKTKLWHIERKKRYELWKKKTFQYASKHR